MNQITVSDADLRKGAEEGMDAFLKVFIDKYLTIRAKDKCLTCKR